MKTATSLTLVATGAILAFAVTAQPSFFSFHTAGWVLIVIGIVGVVLPRRGYSSLRRRLVLSGPDRHLGINRRQRPFSRLLMPGGLMTEPPDLPPDLPPDAPVEQETIDQFIEE